jgi:hypothetical protein
VRQRQRQKQRQKQKQRDTDIEDRDIEAEATYPEDLVSAEKSTPSIPHWALTIEAHTASTSTLIVTRINMLGGKGGAEKERRKKEVQDE